MFVRRSSTSRLWDRERQNEENPLNHMAARTMAADSAFKRTPQSSTDWMIPGSGTGGSGAFGYAGICS